MNAVRFDLDVNASKTSAVFYRAEGPNGTVVIGHGAGSRQNHPWIVTMAEALVMRRFDVVTFDFLYTHAGRRIPDKNDVLENTWRTVLRALRARGEAHQRLFIGGKSMGGRIATQVAAESAANEIAGLVLFGYPLHPPGKKDRLRIAHLPHVKAPMLFVQGSRDTFGTPEELGPVVSTLSTGSRLFVIEGGDHSLTVRRTPSADTLSRVADEVARFCEPVVTE